VNLDYRLLFECGAECMLVAKADGEILDANLEARRIMCKSREYLVSTGLNGVFDSTDPQFERAFEELRSTGRFEGEVRLLRWHGVPFPAEVSMAAYEDGLVGIIFQDLVGRVQAEEQTKRLNEMLESQAEERTKQLEVIVSKLLTSEEMLHESEERFQIAFDEAAVGIAHVSLDGRWLRVNRRLCEILGYTNEEMSGLTFQDITHPKDLDDSIEHVRRILSGEIETYSMEKCYVRKDDTSVWVSLSVSLRLKPSGEPDYFVSAIDDISARKQAEEQLHSLTPREVEVIKLLAQGKTNKQIARSIDFSEGTAKIHVQRIIAKLGVSGRAEAAARAVELGLVKSHEK